MKKTYHFLRIGHGRPAASSLIRHLLGPSRRAQLLGDLGSVVVHVQEERSQGALGGVRVRGRALALLLVAGTLGRSTRETQGAQQTGVMETEVEGAQIELGRVPVQDGIGVVDVSRLELSDGPRQIHEAGDHLRRVSQMLELSRGGG